MAKSNGQTPDDKSRQQALDLAIGQIEKQYGKGSIMRMGGEGGIVEAEAIASGSLAIDLALGIGGFPRGRIVEIYGPEGAGKTMVSLHAIREAQKAGGTAAFVDAEHALDITFARRIGVDVENLIISQPDSGEQALEIVETLVRSGAFDIIVLDSVAALVPQAELEGDMGDSHMGLHARLMSQALRKLTGSVSKSHSIFVFINQLRSKIGVVFGNPETTTGGNALKFYSSVRLDVRKTTQIKSGEEVIGHRIRAKVVKNKLAPPFRFTELDLLYGEGISKMGVLLDLAVTDEIIQKSGTWFSYNQERLGQGRDNTVRFLHDHPEISEEIDTRLRELHQLLPQAESEPVQETEKV